MSRRKFATDVRRKSLFRDVVVVKKSSSLFSVSTTTSKDSSNDSSISQPSTLSSDGKADDEETMSTSTEDNTPSRPLSVAIPRGSAVHGPYCPRRPNLREILANTSEAPWTLAAFMAYLSNNHCLETLEFTMDAGRYRKHYAKMMSRAPAGATPHAKDREYVQALWQRLVDAYIRPNGSREVNLPSEVRDPLLNLSPTELPPTPETLDSAVAKIYELMEESVLVPFLNSVYPQTAHPTVASYPTSTSDKSIPSTAHTFDERSTHQRRSRLHAKSSPPPPQRAVDPYAHSYSPPSTLDRRLNPSPKATPRANKTQFTAKLSQTTSSPAAPISTSASLDAVASGSNPDVSGTGSGPGMTDDSGSTESPSNHSPTTPPATPPTSDGHSPKRDSGMWKKLGRLSGMKTVKKKSQGGLREEQ